MVSLIAFGAIALIMFVLGFSVIGTNESPAKFFIAGLVFIIVGVISYPFTNVWQRELAGQAQLKEAEWNRQIKIKEAEAAYESAKSLASAEIERAKGAAESNRIVSDGFGGPEGYLRYLYIEGLKQAENNGASVIYIPTEAGLPILEAGKR